MPTRARAIRITTPGDASVLTESEIDVRDPGFGEVLVEVVAAGLNRADIVQRKGHYPAPAGSPADIPGLEYAGTVARVGEGVSTVRVGDRVMGIVGGGAMSTYLVAHERELLPVPASLDLPHAAAIPEVFLTAWDAVFLQGGLTSGETLLVHAVASGVGTAALQLSNAFRAHVLGTSRTAEKLERCREWGLEHGIATDAGTFSKAVLDRTEGRGADVILDPVGAGYAEENLNALAPRGRIVVIGLMGGASAQVPFGQLLTKRATIIGTTLRARPLEEKATLARAFTRQILPLFESGVLKPVLDEVLPMTRIREAHERMERNETFGKLVMTW